MVTLELKTPTKFKTRKILKENLDKGDEFWDYVSFVRRKTSEAEKEFLRKSQDYEWLVKQRIPQILKKKLSEIICDINSSSSVFRKRNRLCEKEELLKALDIKVTNIRYSSAFIDLDFNPFSNLIKIFDEDFDLLSKFFEIYLPSIFWESVTEDENIPQGIFEQINVSFENPIKSAFFTTQLKNRNMNANSVFSTKSMTIWSIANFTLIPLVVVAIYLQQSHQRLVEKVIENQEKRYSQIDAERNTIIDQYKGLLKMQSETYVQLTEQIRKVYETKPKIIYNDRLNLLQYKKLLELQDRVYNNIISTQSNILFPFDSTSKKGENKK